MHQKPTQNLWNTARPAGSTSPGGPFAEQLLSVVDAGIVATICAAPFLFGGRHDLGRLAFVTIVGLTAVAWFARQSLLPKATWTRSAAYAVLLGTVALVLLQLVPLPVQWLKWLAPRTIELLPLWTGSGAVERLGTWNTITLAPRETLLSLAMLVAYGLWFTVLAQRLQTTADVEKLLQVVAIGAVLMAAFGLAQYFTSNGQFFWCYVHPYRTTDKYAMGSFMNRNHFADFLVLGIGPLACALVSVLRAHGSKTRRKRLPTGFAELVLPCSLLGAVALVLMGIALSLSRGGALAAATATIVIAVSYWRWRLIDGKYLLGLAGVGLLLLALLSIYGYDEVTTRLDDLATGSVEAVDHGEGRRKIWVANFRAIEHGGLMGAGAGSHRYITPIYLEDPTAKEYTHAENSYLQIGTENGWVGVALLAVGIGLCAGWCLACWGRLRDPRQQLCFGAAAAGLAASAVHSLVDFVWYIPACLSVTLALAVCVLRLAQMSLGESAQSATSWKFSRPRWLELTAAATLLAGWTIYAFFGPAMAAIHWDRYLRDAVASNDLFDDQLSPLAKALETRQAALREPLMESMQEHLLDTTRWDPSFAEAHLRLAARYVQQFELAQMTAANAMTLNQIGDAAQASSFATPEELRAWLKRAFGENVQLLYSAQAHARQAAALNPLEGKAYIYLADLGFLAGESPAANDACVAQAQLVRPYDGDVLYEVGRHLYVRGEFDQAMNQWLKCYGNSGLHQLRIVNLLAGRMPAGDFLAELHPDWRTLREIWERYRQLGQPQDLVELAAYAAKVTERDVRTKGDIPPAHIWLWQASMYRDLKQQDQALECLQRAYECNQHVYSIRFELGYALKAAGKFSEAEPHLRWCLARRPENRGLRAAILEISKLRTAERSEHDVASLGENPNVRQ